MRKGETALGSPDREAERIASQAAAWLAAMNSDVGSAVDADGFRQWLDADERHRRAYDALQAIWTDVGELRGRFAHEDYAPATGAGVPAGRRWRRIIAPWPLAAAAAVLVVAVVVGRTLVPSPVSQATEFATRTGEIQRVHLPDRSIVTLGGLSAIEIGFTATERRVELVTGEAFFSVTPDPERPFVVDATDAEIVVVGTQFEVRRSTDGVRVAVLEGTVEVVQLNRTDQDAERRTDVKYSLTANHKARLRADGTWTMRALPSTERPGAWQEGRLVYENAPLAEVISDCDRYYTGNIILQSGDLDDLVITASFRTDQVPRMMSTLSTILPVTTKTLSNGDIVIRRTGGA